LLALQWSDVDLSGHRLSVSATLQRRGREWYIESTKTAKSRRTIGLPSPAVDTLTAWRQQLEQRLRVGPRWASRWGDLVFTNPTGQPMMAATLTHNFRSTQEQAGSRPVRFHDLRHAAATLMLASGTDLKVVSEVLGHSTIATTANVYAGVLDSLKDNSVRGSLSRERGC
jgi:integrase